MEVESDQSKVFGPNLCKAENFRLFLTKRELLWCFNRRKSQAKLTVGNFKSEFWRPTADKENSGRWDRKRDLWNSLLCQNGVRVFWPVITDDQPHIHTQQARPSFFDNCASLGWSVRCRLQEYHSDSLGNRFYWQPCWAQTSPPARNHRKGQKRLHQSSRRLP